jgi:ATP phosphoribosyltransferase
VSAQTQESLLMDCAAIMRELGVKRTMAASIMRAIPKVKSDDIRKVYVRRSDVIAELNRRMVDA